MISPLNSICIFLFQYLISLFSSYPHPTHPRGESLFERGVDEDPARGALASSLRVMTEVHTRFFRTIDELGGVSGSSSEAALAAADVRGHLRALRSQVLAGCCLVMSRIIPKDDPDPSEHPFWQLALQVT